MANLVIRVRALRLPSVLRRVKRFYWQHAIQTSFSQSCKTYQPTNEYYNLQNLSSDQFIDSLLFNLIRAVTEDNNSKQEAAHNGQSINLDVYGMNLTQFLCGSDVIRTARRHIQLQCIQTQVLPRFMVQMLSYLSVFRPLFL